MDLLLTRIAYLSEGTFGKMTLPSGVILYTVERPWLNNQLGISCIPEGVYALTRRMFFRGGYNTWEITEVPGRKHILIHIANWPREVEGCVGLGTGLELADYMVVNSARAFKQFMVETAQFDRLSLEINSVKAVL